MMARPVTNLYDLPGATKLTQYAELEELIRTFSQGGLQCLAIVAPPGLGKSELLNRAIAGRPARYIRGYMTPLKLYEALFAAREGHPVILDDTEAMIRSVQVREMLTALTETKRVRRLEWSSTSTYLEENGLPQSFETTSPVTIIRNSWDNTDHLLLALASRAEFISFLPTWAEVYKFLAEWFWDQEILDYVHKRLADLRQPDIRVVMKAWQRKVAGSTLMTWQRAIDDHVETDSAEVAIRQLLANRRFKSDNARAVEWVKMGYGHRSTFFRSLPRVKSFWSMNVRRQLCRGIAPN